MLYGRAESPYNADYLTAAFASGSSNGSGTATAASFAAFGLGEETWSSGRAPASNNALCAYTPSRGVISVRGNWPLVPTMDVVAPHTRTMADMLEVLDVLVQDDPNVTRGLLAQPAVGATSFALAGPTRNPTAPWRADHWWGSALESLRCISTKTYTQALVKPSGVGGPTGQKIITRPSIITLWSAAKRALELAGADVVTVDFPVVTNYEGDRENAPNIHHAWASSRKLPAP